MADPEPPLPLPSLDAYVRWWAGVAPQREAAVLGNTRLSYRDLDEAVGAHARALVAASVTRGDRVATLAPPGIDFLVTYLAATRIGAIWIGLNPKYRRSELRHIVDNAAPRLLFARFMAEDRDYSGDVAALRASCTTLTSVVALDRPHAPIAQGRADFLHAGDTVSTVDLDRAMGRVTADDPAVIVYTSGSTGEPKGAVLGNRGIVAFAIGQNAVWPIAPLKVLNYFPINHVGCLNDITAPALVAGGTVVFMEQFETRASLQLMQDERIPLWASVPSVFQMQLGLVDFKSYDLSAVRLIVWEGAAMAAEQIERLSAICPSLATNYGMTETTSAITILEPTRDIDVLAHSVGHAFPGVEIRLVGRDGAPVERGEPGEVLARSPLNCLGYWGDAAATSAAFTRDGFFRTGDVGVERPDGRLRIVGRLKEMYKSGGYNVYPREVEAVIEACPGVDAAAVVAAPDPVWDEVGVAYVAGCVDVASLSAWCSQRLANFKIPKRFYIEEALPLLPIGKVDKAALRARAARLTHGDPTI